MLTLNQLTAGTKLKTSKEIGLWDEAKYANRTRFEWPGETPLKEPESLPPLTQPDELIDGKYLPVGAIVVVQAVLYHSSAYQCIRASVELLNSSGALQTQTGFLYTTHNGVDQVELYVPAQPEPEPGPQPPEPEPQPQPGPGPQPQPPEPPTSQPGDVQIEVHAGQTVVVEVKASTILTTSTELGSLQIFFYDQNETLTGVPSVFISGPSGDRRAQPIEGAVTIDGLQAGTYTVTLEIPLALPPDPSIFVGEVNRVFEVLEPLGAYQDYSKPEDPNNRGVSRTVLFMLKRGDLLWISAIEHRVQRDNITGTAYEIVKGRPLLLDGRAVTDTNEYYFWIVYGGVSQVIMDQKESASVLASNLAAWTGKSPWTGLNKEATTDRIMDLIKNPWKISQASLNLCGPAAFLRVWIPRDPIGFVKAAVDLYRTGCAKIGSWKFTSDTDLLRVDYAALKASVGSEIPPTADWMIMGSIRGASNAVLGYEGEPWRFWKPTTWIEWLRAINFPSDLAHWLESTGLYSKVVNSTSLYGCADITAALKLPDPAMTTHDVLLLVNDSMLKKPPGFYSFVNRIETYPTHWVVLESKIQQVVVEKAPYVSFSYWSWGCQPTLVEAPVGIFNSNYYGAIVGEIK